MRNYRHSLRGVSGFRKLLLLLLITVSARAADTLQISYSQSFANATTYCPGTTQWDEWTALRDSMDITAMDFVKVVVSSDLNPTGYTLEGSANVNAIVQALNTGVDTLINDGNYKWVVKSECFDSGTSSCIGADTAGMSLEIYDLANPAVGCDCFSAAAIRPEIGNPNWGGVSAVGSETVCGSGSQTMSVVFHYFDILPPVAVCNADTVYLDQFGLASVDPYVIGAGSYDLHSGVETIELDTSSFDCDQTGPHTLTLTVTDSAGNTDDCTATVTVLDVIAPTVVCKDTTIYLNASGYAFINNDAVLSLISDNCTAAPAVTLSMDTFRVAEIGVNAVTVVATDISSNVDSCIATVTVVDNIPPVANCQSVTLYLDASGMATLVADSLNNGSTDNTGAASLSYTASNTAYDCSHLGSNSVTMYATDMGGNVDSCTTTVTILDTLNPTAIAQDITVYLDANGEYTMMAVDANNGSTDNCDSLSFSLIDDFVNCDSAAASPIVGYLVATDGSGNTDTATFNVTVLDTIGPALNIVDTLTVYLDSTGVYTATDAEFANVQDSCGVNGMSPNLVMVDCDDIGWDTVVVTADDIYGNVSTDSFALQILDTIRPEVTTVSSITVYLDSTGASAIDTTGIVTGSWDNCTVDSLAFSISSVSCSDLDSTLLTVNSIDNSGNWSVDSEVTVYVMDTIAPIANSYDSVTVYADGTGLFTFSFADLDSMTWENCSIDTVIMSPATVDCDSIGSFTTVTMAVYDLSGNVDTTYTVVEIVDTLAPVVVTMDSTIALDASGSATVDSAYIASYLVASVTDNCTTAPNMINIDPTSFDCNDLGMQTVSFSYIDTYGNTSYDTVDVEVIDTLTPVAMAQNGVVYLDANGIAAVDAMTLDNGSYDNCDIVYSTDRDTFYCDEEGLNLIKFYVTDAAGNVDSADAFIYVYDTIAPVLDVQNITVQLDANGVVNISPEQIDVNSTDNCADQLNMTLDVSSFDCSDIGTNNVVFTAFDENGQSSSATVTVTVQDVLAPVVLTQSVTVNLDASGNASVTAAMLDNGTVDNCAVDTMYLDVYDFTCANLGDNPVYLTAEDAQGNAHSAVAIVTVVDNIAPAMTTQDITVSLDAAGEATITADMIDNGSTDVCGITLSLDITSFNCSNVGANTVTLTGTDPAGNVSTATATVTVEDNTNPVAVAQDITVQLDATGNATINATMIDNGSSDECGVSTAIDITSFDCMNVGANTVTLTATDANANTSTATAIVTVEDNIAPNVITQSITVGLDSMGNATITAAMINNGSSDNCGIDTMTLDVYDFTCANIGENAIYLTVTDDNGNSNSAVAVVTVEDNIAPQMMTQNITVSLDAAGEVTITPDMVDNGSMDECGLTLSLDVADFNCANIGDNTVTLTGTDANGNISTATATVTVEDNLAPVAVAQSITVALDVNGEATVTSDMIDNGSYDNCSFVLTQFSTTYSCDDLGNHIVILVVTDAEGNASTATATVTVVDDLAPVAVSQSLTIQLDANGDAAIASASELDGGSSDNCTEAADLGFAASQLTFDASNLGTNNVDLTVSDDEGNETTVNAVVIILDTIAPVSLGTTNDVVVYTDSSSCSAIATYDAATFSDNAGDADVTVSYSISSGSVFGLGTTTITATGTDASGNSTSETFTVTVMDNIAPEVVSVPTVFNTVFDTPNCQGNVTWQAPVAIDNCSGVTYTSTHNSGDMFPVGTTTVSYTAFDAAGNSTSVSFDVTVVDPVAPTFSSAMADLTVNATTTACEAPASWLSPLSIVSDNCGGVTVETDHTSGDVFPIGETVVTVTATDDAGNFATTSFTVTVVDVTSPTLVLSTADITIETTDCDAATATDYDTPTFADNCDFTVVQTAGLPSGSVFPVGTTENTFVATDASGNFTETTFTVTVEYTASTAPTLDAVPDLCIDGPLYALPTEGGAVVYDHWAVTGDMFWPGVVGSHDIPYTYTDPVTGCETVGLLTVDVIDLPQDVVIEQIGSDLLSVVGNYDSYQWYRNASAISGATTSELTITQGGLYECVVTVGSNCEGLSNTLNIGGVSGPTLGTEEIELGELIITPNPNDGQFFINFNNNFNGDVNVDVYDLRGAKVRTVNFEEVSTNSVDVDLSDLSAAMYQLVIRHNEYITRAKIVITK